MIQIKAIFSLIVIININFLKVFRLHDHNGINNAKYELKIVLLLNYSFNCNFIFLRTINLYSVYLL